MYIGTTMILPKKERQLQFEYLLDNQSVYGINYRFSKIEFILKHLDSVIEASVGEVKENLSNETDHDVIRSMYFQPDIYFMNVDYTDTFKKSLFISLFSEFENCIDEIIIGVNNGVFPTGIRDFPNRAKHLRSKQILPANSADWDEADRLRLIRNDIIHNASQVNRATFLKQHSIPGITCVNGDYIKVTSSDFIKHAVSKLYAAVVEIVQNA